MASRAWVALAGAAAALTLASPVLAAPKAGRLVAFRSCAQLVGYAKAHASAGPVLRTGLPGIALPAQSAAAAGVAGASSPQLGVDYSGTNDQETGVDEPDAVKTDGNTLFAISGNAVEAVDISGRSPKLLDTLQLSNTGFSHELLLSGTHLLVLSRGGYFVEPLPAQPAAMIAPLALSSTLTEVDVADPSHLSVLGTMTLNGEYVTARMIGSTVRVVSSSSLPLEVPSASKLLPTYTLGARAARPLVQCRDVWRPPVFSGYGMLTVLTLDLAKGLAPVDTTSVMTDGRIVYASPTDLYVATEKWSVRPLPASPQQPPVPAADVSTQIHDFDISDPTKTTYLGSGTVPGYLLDQYSLSDFQGVLRVVSTSSPAWWGAGPATQSYLTTLRASGGTLQQVGQLGGLGQGERVYSVRFDGNDAYVCTFRQIDPLHTIDVSDPAQPRLAGVLSVEGYSSYLHPLGNGLLLGVGQDVPTTTQPEPSGSELTLFDVSDLAHPTRLAHVSLGPGWSNAESDHHAFLYWPATGLVVVPLNGKAEAYRVARSGFTLLGAVAHPTGSISRSLVDRTSLVTVSDGGVQANALDTLAMLGWAPFPAQPQPVPVPMPGPIQPGGPIVKTSR